MRKFFMPTRTKWLNYYLSGFIWMLSFGGHAALAQSVALYTPYTKISVPPGESIDYKITVINNSTRIRDVAISLDGLPDEWNYALKSGGWSIEQLAVLPGEKKNFSLQVKVPLKVKKGSYRFRVIAAGYDQLPITVTVSEEGTYKTEFTAKQPNMEGHADATFTFNANLQNQTAEEQLYALRAQTPRGWSVSFKASYKQVTSVNIEPNNSKDITIEINPPNQIKAGTYKIPIQATTTTTSASLDLEVVITGSYDMELTTPTGLLSTRITAGDEKRIELLVKNTGSAELSGIELSASSPANWDVVFDPGKVDKLAPGRSTRVFATVKAGRKAIAGDYVTTLRAKTPEAGSNATFRVSVRTPMLWGWVGILIILGVIGCVFYLFRKYGRR